MIRYCFTCWHGNADAVDKDKDHHVSMCRALLSSIYRPTDAGRRSPAGVPAVPQPTDKLRASLVRRFGAAEFTRLYAAIRSLLVTSHDAGDVAKQQDVARQRRLDTILASNDVAAVSFPLFFQLVQLELLAGQD